MSNHPTELVSRLPLESNPQIDENVLAGKHRQHKALFIADPRAELPLGSIVVSATASAKSQWVETLRLETRHSNGSTKLYFVKVCGP